MFYIEFILKYLDCKIFDKNRFKQFKTCTTMTMGAFHLVTQVNTSVILSFLAISNKDKTILVSTYH